MKKVIKISEQKIIEIVNKIITEAQYDLNNNVANIQKALKALGQPYSSLLGTTGPNKDGIDGIYGSRTKNAVIEFQKANGIKPTGFVGKVTAPKLGVNPMTGEDSSNIRPKTKTQKEPIKNDTVLSNDISDEYKNKINTNKMSASDSTVAFKTSTLDCSRFVNEFSKKYGKLGDAWTVHDNDQAGKRVWDAFSNLNTNIISKITELYNTIKKAKGGVDNGNFVDDARQLIRKIIYQKPQPNASFFKLNDIVGIFYPPSSHHEQAYIVGADNGKGYFLPDGKGNYVPGNNLKSGQAWGMNTHVGYVGAIKNGVPIIFHNVKGTVLMDPYNKLFKDSKIAWIKRA